MIKDTNQNPTDTKLHYIEQAAISSARANKELDLTEKAAAVHVIAGEERATIHIVPFAVRTLRIKFGSM